MKINLTLIALSAALASILSLPHVAEARSLNGAGIGTPGAENKGNPIPVPKGSHTRVHHSASTTTPGEESKGNRKGRPLTSY